MAKNDAGQRMAALALTAMVVCAPVAANAADVGNIDGVQLPKADHSIAVDATAFQGFGVAGPLDGKQRDQIAADCAAGKSVAMHTAVVTIGLDAIELAGRDVGLSGLDGGLVPLDKRKGRMLPDLFLPLMDVSSTSRQLAKLGCTPWDPQQRLGAQMPALLLAVDKRVPSATLDLVLYTATQAHFDRVALWVEDKRPGKDPVPSAPRNAGFMLTITDGYAAVTGYAVEVREVLPGVDLALAADRALGAGALPVGAQLITQFPREWTAQQATFVVDKAAEHGHACVMLTPGFGPDPKPAKGKSGDRMHVPSGKLSVLPLHVSGIGTLGEKVDGDVLVTGSRCPASRDALLDLIESNKLPGQFPLLEGVKIIPDVSLPESEDGEDWASDWGL